LAVLKADGRARALLMKAMVVAVVLLFIATVTQTALWWYIVTRLFHV
jgi:conjugal transfer/entry exclusion protein